MAAILKVTLLKINIGFCLWPPSTCIKGDPLHSRAFAHSRAPLFTQPCPHCSHSRAPGEHWARLCVFTLQGCVQAARLCRGSPVCIRILKLKFQSKLDLCSGLVLRKPCHLQRRTDKLSPAYPRPTSLGRGIKIAFPNICPHARVCNRQGKYRRERWCITHTTVKSDLIRSQVSAV